MKKREFKAGDICIYNDISAIGVQFKDGTEVKVLRKSGNENYEVEGVYKVDDMSVIEQTVRESDLTLKTASTTITAGQVEPPKPKKKITKKDIIQIASSLYAKGWADHSSEAMYMDEEDVEIKVNKLLKEML